MDESSNRLSRVKDIRESINGQRDVLDRLRQKEEELSERLSAMYRHHVWPSWFKWFVIGVFERKHSRLNRTIDRVGHRIARWEFVADTLFDVENVEDFLE